MLATVRCSSTRSSVVVSAFCSALIAACAGPTDSAPSSPFGHDTTLYGEWDVNHEIPSPSVCAVAGITHVEVVFFRPDEPDVEFTSPTLRFPCEDGFYDSSGVKRIAAGTWQYQWRAYAGSTVVLRSMLYTATAIRGGDLELHPIDWGRQALIDLDIALRWATDTGLGTCAEAFTDTMSWELREGTSAGALKASSVGTAACANTIALHGYDPKVLTAGLYTLVIHGAATDGAAWSAECSVTAPEGGPAMASCDVPRMP